MAFSSDPALNQLCQREIVAAGVASAASLALARRGPGGWELFLGAAGRLARGRAPEVDVQTPFDLASVTKSFFAASLARLAASGRLSLAAPLASMLPEAAGTPAGRASLELLLAHRAGLVAHLPFFAPLLAGLPFDRRQMLVSAAHATRPECRGPLPPEGFAPLYSDLGYLLAGEAVRRELARDLDEVVREEIAVPLGIEIGSARQWLAKHPGFARRVAATENVPWRGGVLAAVVHDENAWALVGHGMAGHAGLFGRARDVARFGCELLDVLDGRSPWLARGDLEPLVQRRPGGTLRAGFDGVSGTGSAAGTRFGAETFGHLGFTGTSLWCDPDTGWVGVILTNRVHPTREHVAIRAARPRIQDALAERARTA